MQQKALLFGIQSFNNPAVTKLYGCLNDIDRWETVLTSKLGFSIDSKKINCDVDEAREVLEQFIKSLQENDSGVIVFSGHGVKVEKVIEGIVYVAEGLFFSDGYLLDYDIHLILKKLDTKAKLIFVLDCCYSRGVEKPYKRLLKLRKILSYLNKWTFLRINFNFNDEPIARFFTPKLPIKLQLDIATILDMKNDIERSQKTPLKIYEKFPNVTIISAVENKVQLAYERSYDKKSYGLFSYYATQLIDLNNKITYQELEKKVNSLIAKNELHWEAGNQRIKVICDRRDKLASIFK